MRICFIKTFIAHKPRSLSLQSIQLVAPLTTLNDNGLKHYYLKKYPYENVKSKE